MDEPQITRTEIEFALKLNAFLTPFNTDDRVIIVVGENEPMPWIRSGINPQVKVIREGQFATEWPEHAASNAGTHIYISAAVETALPLLHHAASITNEGTT
jgi:hypothetical protein